MIKQFWTLQLQNLQILRTVLQIMSTFTVVSNTHNGTLLTTRQKFTHTERTQLVSMYTIQNVPYEKDEVIQLRRLRFIISHCMFDRCSHTSWAVIADSLHSHFLIQNNSTQTYDIVRFNVSLDTSEYRDFLLQKCQKIWQNLRFANTNPSARQQQKYKPEAKCIVYDY